MKRKITLCLLMSSLLFGCVKPNVQNKAKSQQSPNPPDDVTNPTRRFRKPLEIEPYNNPTQIPQLDNIQQNPTSDLTVVEEEEDGDDDLGEAERMAKEEAQKAREKAENENKLRQACKDGDLNSVKKLIEDGVVDINICDWANNTLLHTACANGHLEVAKYLLGKNVNVDSENNGGETPLILACETKNEDLIKLLIDNGANVFAKDSAPIKRICSNGLREIIKYLIENSKKDKDEVLNTVLVSATSSYKDDIVDDLICSGYRDFSEKTLHEAFFEAVANFLNSASIPEKLLKFSQEINKPIDVNYKDKNGNTPLSTAAARGNEKAVKFLLDEGAKVDVKLLADSIEYWNYHIFDILSDKFDWESISDESDMSNVVLMQSTGILIFS